jgi:thiamine pyrophosphate-dependent acetolactate synthase large subunit-like protein
VTVIVVVDGSYSLIAQKQNSEGYQAAGVNFGTTNYAATASAMGIDAMTATDAEMLADAVEKTTSNMGPSLIAIPMPPGAYRDLI